MAGWLTLEDVEFAYGSRILFSGFSCELADNEPVLAVVGPSGVGKSTLVKLIAGHLLATRGRITFFGEQVRGPSAQRPVVFQDHNLFPWKTVLENVAFGLKCAGVSRRERRRRALELLARLRLEGTGSLFPAVLSGGMQQRVGLARALAVSPRTILMDEPFSALDNEMKMVLCLEVSRLVGEEGMRFVVVTHDTTAAAFLGSRVLTLGGPGEVRNLSWPSPAHPRDREFSRSAEVLARLDEMEDVFRCGRKE